MSENGNKNSSNEELIALIQQKAVELGRTPTHKDVETAAAATAIRRFDSWNNFLASAGLETKNSGNALMSDEEAIRLFQAKAAELGRTPERNEVTQFRAVIKKYGGWQRFLLAARLEPPEIEKFKQISDKRLIELVQVRAVELGRTPKKYEFVQGATATHRYGGWSDFLRAANLEPAKVKKRRKQQRYEIPEKYFSDKQLIELVQARASELGRTPKRYEFAQESTVTNRFGGWRNFLASAGLEIEMPREKQKALSKEKLMELVQAQAAELGRIPQKHEFTQNKWACDQFGGWQIFLYHAGLKTTKPEAYRKSLSNEQLMEAVRAQAVELGRPPKKKEFKHGSQAVNRYGSWIEFLLAAGLKPEKYIQVSNERLVELIRSEIVELGRVPKMEESPYCKVAINRYGGWYNFLKAVEQMPAARGKNILKISNNQMLQLIKAQAVELNRTPTIIEFEYAELAKDKFRSWERFLKSAGLEPIEPPEEKTKIIVKISNEQLIERVQAQAAELGRTPAIREFEHAPVAIKRFGVWSAFLESAGLDLLFPGKSGYKISNEQLLEEVQAKAAELGRTPTIREFHYGRLANGRFGTWRAFLKSAGLARVRVKPRNPKTKISNEQLIELVQVQAAELGRTPKRSEFKHGRLVTSRFGKWSIFLQSAGIDPVKPVKPKPKISNEQLLDLVKERALELGRTPKKYEFKRGELATSRFGTWADFLQSAALEPAKPVKSGYKISNEQLIELVQAQAAELGRTPRKKEFKYGYLILKRFGNWTTFLNSAGLEEAGKHETAISNEQLLDLVKERTVQIGRSPNAKEFRYGTLVIGRFGSWSAFLLKAGLEPAKREPLKAQLNDEELIAAIKQRAVELEKIPEVKDFERASLASYRFGTWNTFLKKAGLI
ncbi:homing endonuclease associated repeat-containing protein [Enterococcus sp. AZ163]|uniref:homing endonuclease associated repeat-containing protein n=1 Tax=Enterococcus sp. AZ163 TaxID=2774638 RepID=UPI003D2D5EE5